jgi:vitamin B12 transporter
MENAMRHLALAIAILGGGIPVLAQAGTEPVTSPSVDTSTASSVPDPAAPSYSATVVVTASLEEEPTRELPTSVSVIPAEDIDQRQATRVVDLLRTVPGLDLVQQGSPGKISSVFLRGTGSTQTLVLWNGIQLNDPSFGGFDWAFLDTAGVERIEVVRGPVSALYGSEAIGGVVQVLTRNEGTGTDLRLEAGGDVHRRGSLSTGLGLGPTHLELSGSVRRGEGELDNDFFDGQDANARLSWDPGKSLDLQAVARWNDAEVGLPFDFLGAPSPHQVSQRVSTEIALPLSWASRHWEVEAQIFRHDSDFETRDPDVGAFDFVDGVRRGARTVLTRHLGSRFWIASGGDWEREEVTTGGTFGPGLRADSQRTWSTFAQLHGAVFDGSAHPLHVEAGVRRDDNDAFGTETSVRGGLVWEAGRGLRLRANYGEGFRAPSLGELFYPGFGNPDLQPETSQTRELALDFDHGPWRMTVAAFDTDLEGLIVSGPPSFLPFNVGRAESRGVETEVGVDTRAVSARLQTTWLDTEDLDTGLRLLRRPEWRSSVVLTWRPAPDWTVNAVARRVGERLDLGPVTLDPYTTVDLAGSWSVREGIEPYARVENLLDEEYEEAAGFPAPDRRLVGGIALQF